MGPVKKAFMREGVSEPLGAQGRGSLTGGPGTGRRDW